MLDGILEPLNLTNFYVCIECIKEKRADVTKLGAKRATKFLELTFINDYSR